MPTFTYETRVTCDRLDVHDMPLPAGLADDVARSIHPDGMFVDQATVTFVGTFAMNVTVAIDSDTVPSHQQIITAARYDADVQDAAAKLQLDVSDLDVSVLVTTRHS